MRIYVDLMHSDDIIQDLKQQALNAFGGIGNAIVSLMGENLNRAQLALENLQWIQENGRPFKVYTPHKIYDNMMIELIAPQNDQKMNEILAADITFKEIIPYKSLNAGKKSSARTPPSAASSDLAGAAGWLSRQI